MQKQKIKERKKLQREKLGLYKISYTISKNGLRISGDNPELMRKRHAQFNESICMRVPFM